MLLFKNISSFFNINSSLLSTISVAWKQAFDSFFEWLCVHFFEPGTNCLFHFYIHLETLFPRWSLSWENRWKPLGSNLVNTEDGWKSLIRSTPTNSVRLARTEDVHYHGAEKLCCLTNWAVSALLLLTLFHCLTVLLYIYYYLTR